LPLTKSCKTGCSAATRHFTSHCNNKNLYIIKQRWFHYKSNDLFFILAAKPLTKKNINANIILQIRGAIKQNYANRERTGGSFKEVCRKGLLPKLRKRCRMLVIRVKTFMTVTFCKSGALFVFNIGLLPYYRQNRLIGAVLYLHRFFCYQNGGYPFE